MHTRDRRGGESPPERGLALIRARRQQILLAAGIDVVVALSLLILVAGLTRPADLNPLGFTLVLIIALIGEVAGWVTLRHRYGAGPGALLLHLRTVDPASGMPAPLPGRDMRTFDRAAGADPLRLATFSAPLPTASDAYTIDAPAYITIEIDDGRRFAVRQHAVIGHRPGVLVKPAGATQIVLTDFSRTVDRVHALVSLVPRGIRIEALTDRAETWIEHDGDRHALLPGTSTEVPRPVDLLLGERRLRLARREAKAGTW